MKVYTAILDDGCFFKHWALCLDGPTKLVLNAVGSSGRFRYEQRTADVREDKTPCSSSTKSARQTMPGSQM